SHRTAIEASGGTSTQLARLSQFLQGLENVESLVGASQASAPEPLALQRLGLSAAQAPPVTGSSRVQARPWPGGIRLSSLPAPPRCVVVSGQLAADLVKALVAAPRTALWRDGARAYRVTAAALLPDQSCG